MLSAWEEEAADAAFARTKWVPPDVGAAAFLLLLLWLFLLLRFLWVGEMLLTTALALDQSLLAMAPPSGLGAGPHRTSSGSHTVKGFAMVCGLVWARSQYCCCARRVEPAWSILCCQILGRVRGHVPLRHSPSITFPLFWAWIPCPTKQRRKATRP